ncbi:hypothetical protein CRM22_007492 [Opisthorchis felineus]|uniref:Uncharacterized protein n=1 Tax=Opisthorchis felineus TaxID=147828 RepID=A0A4S2LFK9_OPIFE|nr:hypothetical protein CRM22_007492 [Opisthorchis felineus]
MGVFAAFCLLINLFLLSNVVGNPRMKAEGNGVPLPYLEQSYGYNPMEDATSATLVRPSVVEDAELVAATRPQGIRKRPYYG